MCTGVDLNWPELIDFMNWPQFEDEAIKINKIREWKIMKWYQNIAWHVRLILRNLVMLAIYIFHHAIFALRAPSSTR